MMDKMRKDARADCKKFRVNENTYWKNRIKKKKGKSPNNNETAATAAIEIVTLNGIEWNEMEKKILSQNQYCCCELAFLLRKFFVFIVSR